MSTSETPERSWPDCGEVQCKQVHDFMDTLLETLGVDTDKNTLAIGKGIQIATSVNELKAELTAAKAEIPDGYKLAADTLPEQIKLMHAGLTAFHKNGEALEQSRDAWKKMAENLFNELLYFKEWAITLNSLIDHKATPESFDKLNETLNTYEKLLKEDER